MRRRLAAVTAALPAVLVACGPTGNEPAATPPDAETVVFLGDSYTVGLGGNGRGYTGPTAERMGWRGVEDGQSGTGYVNPSPAEGQLTYTGRVPEVAAAEPDVVVVQGSTNDVGFPPDMVGQAADILYAALAEAVPDARIVVVGPLAPPAVDPQGVRVVRDELAAAAAAAGLPFIDPIADGWLMPADGHFPDGVHPDAGGYAEMAEQLVDALRAEDV